MNHKKMEEDYGKVKDLNRGVQGNQGPQGIQGKRGERGVTGPMGLKGEGGTNFKILGSYKNKKELMEQQFQGKSGDAFLVGKELYVYVKDHNAWEPVGEVNGIKGEQGPQGEQGMEGPQGMQGIQGPQGMQGKRGPTGATGVHGGVGIVPFASGKAVNLETNEAGEPSNASVIGFGNSESVLLQGKERIELTSSLSYAFSIPRDCIVNAIYVSLGNEEPISLENTHKLYPQIQLYRAYAGSNHFSKIKETAKEKSVFYHGFVSEDTILSYAQKDLDIELYAGERILIVGSISLVGENLCKSEASICFSGGINFV